MRTHILTTSILTLVLGASALAKPDVTINPDVPTTGTTPTAPSTTDGFVFYDITFTDGSTKSVRVKVPAGVKDNAKKRELIQKAFEKEGFTASETTGGNVSVAGAAPGGKTIKGVKLDSRDGETDKISMAGAVPGTFCMLTFNGPLSGLSYLGQPAAYTAGFGFDGFAAQTTIGFGDLTNPTLGGLMSQIFNELHSQLPGSLADNLTLSHDAISFSFPMDAMEPYVTEGNSDWGLGSDFRIEQAPEGGSLAFLLAGIVPLAAFCRRRQAVKR